MGTANQVILWDFDGTQPALDALSRLGWRHVILSNHVPELEDIVIGLRIRDRFADVITSALIGYEKRHPEAFRIGLAKAGQPETVRMVEPTLTPIPSPNGRGVSRGGGTG